MSEWISVNQATPPEDVDVWAYQEDGVQLRALINDGEWFEHNCAGEFEGVNRDITHWMPLPAPPEASPRLRHQRSKERWIREG